MDQNFNKEGTKTQLTDSFGKLVCSYTTHIKMCNILIKRNNLFKIVSIVLSSLSTGGLLAVLSDWNAKLFGIISAILTTLMVILTTYLKSSCLDEKIYSHRHTANQLWILREKYNSLLTDFDYLSGEVILERRDKYTEELSEIYKTELPTNAKAYKLAQKALKQEEEQYFSDSELNLLLPKHLRTNNEEKE